MVKKLLLLVLVGSMISAGGEGAPERAIKMSKKSVLAETNPGIYLEDDDCSMRCLKVILEEPCCRVVVGVPLFCCALITGIIQYNLGMLENKPERFKKKAQ